VPFDPSVHHRRSVRLPAFDYAGPGAYFVTICTRDREYLFGDIADGVMRLSPLGRIARQEWIRTHDVRPDVVPDAFVVMPDHVHGILLLTSDGREAVRHPARVGAAGPRSGSVAAIVGQFKSVVTKRINARRGTPRGVVWQRGYYERVIRGRTALARIRQYMADNPARWDPNPHRALPPG
jgi:REP element-mobilizing transposase RayT